MPPKKGKGKGKKKKKDKNAITNVDRTFYELTIVDLNKKLARLRKYIEGLDERNIAVVEKLRSLEEDRVDVAAHLERTLAARDETIITLEEQLKEITRLRDEEAALAQEKITELESKYKAMHNQLISEIKLLSGKLNSLDEFRLNREALFAKFEEQEMILHQEEEKQKEQLYNMEQRAVVEKDQLVKDVEQKLLQVSEDFTRSSEIRNAGYTRRLMRENIALQKEIDRLLLSQIKLQLQYNNQKEKQREIVQQYASLDLIKTELVRNSVNKIKIIEGLTKNYEELKNRYVKLTRYRVAYEELMCVDVAERDKHRNCDEKIRGLTKRMEGLMLENRHYVLSHEAHESEIQRLREKLQTLRETVVKALRAQRFVKVLRELDEQADPTDPELKGSIEGAREQSIANCHLSRLGLLNELMEIIGNVATDLPPTPSISTIHSVTSNLYAPGKIGFMQKPTRDDFIVELGKQMLIPHSDSIGTMPHSIAGSIKSKSTYPIVDVEIGSDLYVSSSRTEEMLEPEEEPLEDAAGSSSTVSVQKEASKEASIAEMPTAVTEQTELKTAESVTDALTAYSVEFYEQEEEDYEINPYI